LATIIDGGLSTELENLGAKFEGPLWTGRTLLDDPALIEQAHRNYIQAGAKVLITSSYQISSQGFSEIGLSATEAANALSESVAVAKRAAQGTNVLVAASIGPYGAVLHDGSEYKGNYQVSEQQLIDFHAERIRVLEAAEPDILLAETIPDLVEAQALAEALKDTKLPVWVSFTAGSADQLWSGALVTEAVLAISQIPTLQTIGFNCVNPALVEDLVKQVRSVSNLDIAVYPNKGGVWDAARGAWNYQEGKTLIDYWPQWQELGLSYVGGCCGTDASDIQHLAATVNHSS
jgi:homocysteine S-methyltransferase